MLCLKYVTGHRSDQAVKSYNDRPSIEQQKKMSHVLSEFVSAGASKASPCTGISAAAKENECHGQQERQPQSEGTVLVQNQLVNTEVRQSERRSFPAGFLQLQGPSSQQLQRRRIRKIFLNFEHYLTTSKLPKPSFFLAFERLNISRFIFVNS